MKFNSLIGSQLNVTPLGSGIGLFAIANPSVCHLFVTFVRLTQGIEA